MGVKVIFFFSGATVSEELVLIAPVVGKKAVMRIWGGPTTVSNTVLVFDGYQ